PGTAYLLSPISVNSWRTSGTIQALAPFRRGHRAPASPSLAPACADGVSTGAWRFLPQPNENLDLRPPDRGATFPTGGRSPPPRGRRPPGPAAAPPLCEPTRATRAPRDAPPHPGTRRCPPRDPAGALPTRPASCGRGPDRSSIGRPPPTSHAAAASGG